MKHTATTTYNKEDAENMKPYFNQMKKEGWLLRKEKGHTKGSKITVKWER